MALSHIPNHTAVRVALWRALHVELDSPPHILQDLVGLELAAPESGWRDRPDMHPLGTAGYRASIVGRARFLEDLVREKMRDGLDQYVILGAGLDTFAQRHPEVAGRLRVFEIEEPATQEWKKRRLRESGKFAPNHPIFVPVDFEAGESWRERLVQQGFDPRKPALFASTGVSMYLTQEANCATLRELAGFAPGSTAVVTFLLPPELVDEKERAQYRMVMERAAGAGTPFLSLFDPPHILDLARDAGFREVRHIDRAEIVRRYFSGRSDGLSPASGEEILVLRT